MRPSTHTGWKLFLGEIYMLFILIKCNSIIYTRTYLPYYRGVPHETNSSEYDRSNNISLKLKIFKLIQRTFESVLKEWTCKRTLIQFRGNKTKILPVPAHVQLIKGSGLFLRSFLCSLSTLPFLILRARAVLSFSFSFLQLFPINLKQLLFS